MSAPQAVATALAASVERLCDLEECRQPLTRRRQVRFCSNRCRTRWYERTHPRISPTHTARKAAGSIKAAVLEVLKDGKFYTVDQIAAQIGASGATVSARLRELRREVPLLRDQLRGNGHTPHRWCLGGR